MVDVSEKNVEATIEEQLPASGYVKRDPKKHPDRARCLDTETEVRQPLEPDDELFGRWADIRELTAITYALDAAIQEKAEDLNAEVLDKIFALLKGDTGSWGADGVPTQLCRLIGLLSISQKNPGDAGVAAHHEEWPSEFICQAIDAMKEWLSDDFLGLELGPDPLRNRPP